MFITANCFNDEWLLCTGQLGASQVQLLWIQSIIYACVFLTWFWNRVMLTSWWRLTEQVCLMAQPKLHGLVSWWFPDLWLHSFVPLILQDLCSQNKLHLPELTLVGFCSLNLCLTPETKSLILIFHGATLGYSGAVSTQWWCKQWFMVKWKGLKTGKGSNASKVT